MAAATTEQHVHNPANSADGRSRRGRVRGVGTSKVRSRRYQLRVQQRKTGSNISAYNCDPGRLNNLALGRTCGRWAYISSEASAAASQPWRTRIGAAPT